LEKESIELLLNKKNTELIHLKNEVNACKESLDRQHLIEETFKFEQKRHLDVLDEKQTLIRDLEDRLKEQEKELRKIKKI